ncbi:basic amino acid ABC transporter substrate-binding protein [Caldinitratiruptor microaerophilus]|uniref:Amino acid ABC transporter, periplasmic amino acid-binding protein n=1 Tax=Caldinitratiruptor microaerophilus TaxID=671077 RepID=A0AA35CMM2_9FIRM|nr:transporter substrate-binding domain-containing protein [Caldinitratiruptor microaerophilus]BDG60146.1 amino acid ABC transporter, periplasmic amino acid-binding protein [Caldinitratiruptor microaerophilus]
MKRLALVGVILSLVLSMAGCGGGQPAAPQSGQSSATQSSPQSQPAAQAPSAPQPSAGAAPQAPEGGHIAAIKKAGKLVIGTSADYPPFESLDQNNNIVGFDIDLAREIAKELGVELEVLNITFDGLIPALLAKKFDFMIAGLTITEERKKSVDFSKPYMSGGNAIVVHKDTQGISKLDDLKGKTIAVQLGSAQDQIASKVEGAQVKRYPLYTDAAMAVATKQVDSMILHSVVAKAFVAQDPRLKMVAELDPVDTGIAFRPDSDDLREFVDQVLDKMKQDGRMDALVKKWFK